MYASLLEGDHESPCAKAGLTAAGNILAAQRLQAAGLYTNIPKLISDAIAAYPNVQIPQVLLDGFAGADVVTGLYAAGLTAAGDEALKTLIQSNPSGAYPNGLSRQIRASRGFAVAAMLEKRGFHDEAVTAYQQTLTAFPDATPPATVSSLFGPARAIWMPAWPYEQRAWIIAGLVALLLAGLILLLGHRIWIRSNRWLGGGRLMVKPFEAADGPAHYGDGFAAAVRDNIRRLTTTHGHDRIDMVSSWGDPATLPAALSSITPQAGLIAALVGMIAKLLPNRDKSLAGFLHTSENKPVGLSLSLEDVDGRVVNRQSIWVTDYAPLASLLPAAPDRGPIPRVLTKGVRRLLGLFGLGRKHEPPRTNTPPLSTMYPLAYPAAVWALWHFADKRAKKLGTKSWESFTNFGIGVAFQEQSETDRAKDFYQRGLSDDHRNEAAKFNLAALQLQTAEDS